MDHLGNEEQNTRLAVLSLSEYELYQCGQELVEWNFEKFYVRSQSSPCLMHKNSDGRIYFKNRKYYVYTIIALKKFGYEALRQVPVHKQLHSLTISHICGMNLCCEPQHLCIELRKVNQEREHCRHTLRNVFEVYGVQGVQQLVQLRFCDHHPQCI